MIETWLTTLSKAAQFVGDALLAPGYFLWSLATAVTPDLLAVLGINASQEAVTLGIAVAYWLLVLAVGVRAVSRPWAIVSPPSSRRSSSPHRVRTTPNLTRARAGLPHVPHPPRRRSASSVAAFSPGSGNTLQARR